MIYELAKKLGACDDGLNYYNSLGHADFNLMWDNCPYGYRLAWWIGHLAKEHEQKIKFKELMLRESLATKKVSQNDIDFILNPATDPTRVITTDNCIRSLVKNLMPCFNLTETSCYLAGYNLGRYYSDSIAAQIIRAAIPKFSYLDIIQSSLEGK